jgi:hypothetical protein
MKATKLTIKNFGLIKEEELDINKPMIVFYGGVEQGKSSYLNAVKFVLGAPLTDDFISHGENETIVELALESGHIKRRTKKRMKKNEDGTESHDGTYIDVLEAVIDNKKLGKKELAQYVNPFLLDQDFFRNKNPKDRAIFFIEQFGIDTSKIDKDIKDLEGSNSTLRSVISGMSDVDIEKLEEVVKVDEDALKLKLSDANDGNQKLKDVYDATIKTNTSSAENKEKWVTYKSDIQKKMKELKETYEKKIKDYNENISNADDVINQYVEPKELVKPEDKPEFVDVKPIMEELSTVLATNVKYDQYVKDKERAELKQTKQKELSDGEASIKTKRLERTDFFKTIKLSEKIPGLDFNKDGKIEYENFSIDMISDSQMSRLGSQLSSLYPKCFDIQLQDCAESMGSKIFTLVDHAEKYNRNVLCTVVADKPAESRDDVGVYWVDKGKLEEIK